MKEPDFTLVAQDLLVDPRIKKAKELLLAALKDHQQKIKGVRPPNPHLKISYEQQITAISHYRGTKLWYPYLGSGIGKGALVELLDGSVKYDFISGIGVHHFGHSHPNILISQIDGALSNTVMQGHLQQNKDALAFMELLAKASGLTHSFLTTSGAMANENALKIALQKKFPANRILAFERCFVGRTLAISQITDKPKFREGLPLNVPVDYIPFFDPESPEKSIEDAVSRLKKTIKRYPGQHAVMIFELVQGEAGCYPGSFEFFSKLMEILKENSIAIFADEVQTFGRTQELFAYQYFNLQSFIDIATIGKMSQCCATLFTEEFKPRPALLSQTYSGATSAIHAGQVIIEELINGSFFGPQGKIQKIEDFFHQKLQEMEKRNPHLIKGPYGIGAMVAFTPFGGDENKVVNFVHKLFENGVISFIAGENPTRVRFLLPAGVLTEEDSKNALEIVERTLLGM